MMHRDATRLLFVAVLTAFLSESAASVLKPAACSHVSFTLPTSDLNSTQLSQTELSVAIDAIYCPPAVDVPSRRETVQLLLHGGTYNKYTWSALGPVGSGYHEQQYSWVDFFRRRGYHTVAIDRLGAGNSTRPHDPTLVTAPVETAVQALMIKELQGPAHMWSALPLHIQFKQIILVGHSYGSFLIDIFFRDYPSVATSLSATVLTGYAHFFDSVAAGSSKQDVVPARQAHPEEFGSLDPGYVTIATAQNRRVSFYGPDGSFDPAIPVLDFQREDAQPQGEINSIATVLGPEGFPTFVNEELTSPLAFLLGQQDNGFCDGECGANGNQSNPARRSQKFYPSVKQFGTHITPNTGHDVNLHFSAPETFRWVADWLENIGL